MAKMQLIVRDDLRDWAERRVGEGQYESSDALVNALLEQARDEETRLAWLQTEIDKGLASGIDPRPVEQIFADILAKHTGPNA